ncbi:MAG: response regulator transcription factor [Burkholderiales bacterium]|jgi:DNA-binding NarL/FixJ family response regulator|nr:response regulator transcription factor [Burkholderiales bacterium]
MASDRPIDVFLVEDDPEFARRLAAAVASDPGFRLVGTAATAAEALEALEQVAADIYLVDLGLPDADGTVVIAAVRRRRPDADIVVVTVLGDDPHVVRSIECGATGYLLKDVTPKELVARLRELRNGGSPISPLIARRLLQRLRPGPAADAEPPRLLSPREAEVLQLVAKGFGFGEIARLLGTSEQTIPSHVKNIYRKLAVHSRSEAVYEASRLGIIRL